MSNNTYVYIDYQYDKCKDKDSFVNKFKKDFHCAAFTVETYNYNEGDPYINNFKIVFSDKHLIQMKFKNKNKNNIIERALKNGQDQGTYEINYNVQSEPCYISEVAAMCYPGQLYRFNNEIRVASTLLNPGSSKLLSNNYYIVNTREYKVGGESMGVFGKKPDTTTPNTKYYTYTKPLSYPDGESSTNRVAWGSALIENGIVPIWTNENTPQVKLNKLEFNRGILTINDTEYKIPIKTKVMVLKRQCGSLTTTGSLNMSIGANPQSKSDWTPHVYCGAFENLFQGQAISRICLTTRKVYEDGYHDNPTPPEVVNSILNFTNNCYQKSCLTYGGESGDSFSSYSAFEEGDYNLFMTNLSSTAYYPLEKEDLDNSSTRYTIISQVKTTSGRQIVAHDTGMGGVDRYYQQWTSGKYTITTTNLQRCKFFSPNVIADIRINLNYNSKIFDNDNNRIAYSSTVANLQAGAPGLLPNQYFAYWYDISTKPSDVTVYNTQKTLQVNNTTLEYNCYQLDGKYAAYVNAATKTTIETCEECYWIFLVLPISNIYDRV